MSFICIIICFDETESGEPTIYPIKKFSTLEESIEYCKKFMYEEYIDILNGYDGVNLSYIEDKFTFLARVISLDTMEVEWCK